MEKPNLILISPRYQFGLRSRRLCTSTSNGADWVAIAPNRITSSAVFPLSCAGSRSSKLGSRRLAKTLSLLSAQPLLGIASRRGETSPRPNNVVEDRKDFPAVREDL